MGEYQVETFTYSHVSLLKMSQTIYSKDALENHTKDMLSDQCKEEYDWIFEGVTELLKLNISKKQNYQ